LIKSFLFLFFLKQKNTLIRQVVSIKKIVIKKLLKKKKNKYPTEQMDSSRSPPRTLGGGGGGEEVGIECGKWVELPEDVMASILKRVGAIGILTNVERVCKTWRNICKEPSMWRSIDMRNLGDIWDMDYDMVKICRHAVDRSSGALLHINIEYFGTDDLLLYIADRYS
jgi:hypothetical protein